MAGQPVWVEKQTLTFTPPVTGALYSLIRANDAGVLSKQDGTPVANLNGLAKTDIPAVAAGYVTLWAVRLYAGQTVISWTTAAPDLVDLRFATNGELSAVGHTHVEANITDLDHNAQKIKGVPVVAPNAGNDQQALIYDDASVTFKYGASGGNGGGGDLYWYVDGALAVATGVDKRIVAPYDMTITNVIINVKTKGSANTTTIDININGVSIFAIPPTIAWNDADGIVEILATTVDIAEDDIITMDIDAIATGAADLTVCVVVSNASVVDTVPSLRAIMRMSFR
jgi:hypothetical protein